MKNIYIASYNASVERGTCYLDHVLPCLAVHWPVTRDRRDKPNYQLIIQTSMD